MPHRFWRVATTTFSPASATKVDDRQSAAPVSSVSPLGRLNVVSALDRTVLAERAATVERHLARVAERLPKDASGLKPATDISDAVILHLWQAVQIVIDLALSACLHFNLGTPTGYADAFRRLAEDGFIVPDLADRLARAAGFRNVVAHAYESIDMRVVHRAASEGPADLRAFLRCLRDRLHPDARE